jgi:streptogramin lyase
MASTPTTRLRLNKPANNDAGWDSTLNADLDALDALAPLGALFVSVAENPSSSLNIRVAAGTFANQAGTAYVTYAGTASYAVTTATTNKVWLTNAAVLSHGAAYPTTAHVRLASVAAGATTITSITDDRVVAQAIGTP